MFPLQRICVSRLHSALCKVREGSVIRQRFQQLHKFKQKHTIRQRNDNIPKDYTIIYENNNRRYLAFAFPILAGTFVPTLGMMVWQFSQSDEEVWTHRPKMLSGNTNISMGNPEEVRIGICLALVLNSLLLFAAYKMLRVAIYRVYMNETAPNNIKFIAVKRDLLLRKKMFKFTRRDVTTRQLKATFSGLPLWKGNLAIHGQPYFMANKDFISSAAYNKMMGSSHVDFRGFAE